MTVVQDRGWCGHGLAGIERLRAEKGKIWLDRPGAQCLVLFLSLPQEQVLSKGFPEERGGWVFWIQVQTHHFILCDLG